VRLVGIYTHYNDLGQVDWVMDAASNRTSYTYSPATGLQISVTDAVTGTVYKAYNAQGQQVATWGAAYPVAFDYDDFGRMVAMYTLRDSSLVISNYSSFITHTSSFDRTVWSYDLATGLLTNKLYSDNRGPSYTYTPDGKLSRRTWARGVTTDYHYDFLSQLTNISYSDNTPAVGFTFDRLGRQTTITDGQGTRAFSYNDALQLAAETNVTGQLTRTYDSLGRSSGFHMGADLGSAPYSVFNSFDSLGRFLNLSSVVGSISNSWNYSFLPNSELLSGWTAVGSGVTVSRNYESNRNLLTGVSNGVGSTLISRFDYVNDAVGRRILRIDAGSTVATNVFGYNSRSELTTALMGANSFAWELDPIGNRVSDSSNSVTHSYTANALNQYTQITNGGLRTLVYDLDGNLTNDGVFAYSWDSENRMIGAANENTDARYSYDYMSRRYQKIVNGVTNNFVYDGWNLVVELSKNGSQIITNRFVWGIDLSGTLQGAGGIGGLLSVTRNGAPYFPCYDANGNITDYVDINGAVVAHREYDAYGNTLVASGPMVNEFSFWFSSKYLDRETGLYYYGHRYYHPETGRWVSRDPIGDQAFVSVAKKHPVVQLALDNLLESDELIRDLVREKSGFINKVIERLRRTYRFDSTLPSIYGFCANNSVNREDLFGLLLLGSYGNFCGPGWCAGKEQSEADCYCNKKYKSVEPVDDMDRACAVHDICLGSGGGKECDKRMCETLRKINPEDLIRIGGPDPNGEIWRWYRKMVGLFCTFDIPTH
jgi:RHS repeat-associated protein